jgi:hypothetical protein
MKTTILTYRSYTVFINKDLLLFYNLKVAPTKDREIINVPVSQEYLGQFFSIRRNILWEQLPLIKGDNLLELVDSINGKVTCSDGKIKVSEKYINKILK